MFKNIRSILSINAPYYSFQKTAINTWITSIQNHSSLQPGNAGDSLIKDQVPEDWIQSNTSVKTEALATRCASWMSRPKLDRRWLPPKCCPWGESPLQTTGTNLHATHGCSHLWFWGAARNPTLQEFQHLGINLASTKLIIAWPNNSNVGQDGQKWHSHLPN